jgi:cell division protein FtsQ
MDGGGRFAGSLNDIARQPSGAAAAAVFWPRPASPLSSVHRKWGRAGKGWSRDASLLEYQLSWDRSRWRRFARFLDRIADRVSSLPRHTGVTATVLLIAASAGYGAVENGQARKVIDFFKYVRDGAATTVGFPIATVSISGEEHLSREEILATIGVTARSSLLFLDVADARARLLTNPWIAEATVQKLLPDRLVISISERAAFALWQKDGRVGVISVDGTVLEPSVLARYADLPLVVGTGAETRAKDFLALLNRRPELRANVRASVLVAERRWNLRLKNGVDVQLPEFDVERALDQFAALEHDVKLSDRDITVIDLRLADRVTVRLSDDAFQAREEAAKKKQKPKGGSA